MPKTSSTPKSSADDDGLVPKSEPEPESGPQPESGPEPETEPAPEEPEPPAFGVYFNCAARGEALYGRPDVDTEVIREILGEFPLIGFFGGYELARVPAGLQLYSYTGVLVLVYL